MVDSGEKSRKKSILELYGLSKYNIEKKYFEKILDEKTEIDDQINSYIKLLDSTKIKINNFYDYLISFFIILIFLIIFFTQYIFNFFEKTKKEWDNYKCDPRVIGYGGYIQKNPGRTEFESTEDNFWECIEPMIHKRYQLSFAGLYDLVSTTATSASNAANDAANDAATGATAATSGVRDMENDTLITTSLTDLVSSVSDLNTNVSFGSNLTTTALFNSFGLLEEDRQNNNSQMNNNSKIFNKLLNQLSTIFSVFNTSIDGIKQSLQSGLVYIYQFFEGMLVLLAILVIGFIIIGGCIMAIAIILFGTGIALLPGLFTTPFGVSIVGYTPTLIYIAWVFFTIAAAFLIIFFIVVITMLLYKEFLEEVFNINLVGRRTETPPNPY